MNDFNIFGVAHAQTNAESVVPEHSAEAEGGGLKIDPFTVAFQALNFLLLLFLLNAILYKPLIKLLKDREKKIHEGVENAEKAEGMLKESHLIREDMLKTTKTETQTMLEKARVAGEQVKADLLTEAQKEADHVIKSGHTLIEMEREKAADDFKGLAVDLVIRAAEKILKEKLDDKKDAQIIRESINNLA